MAFGRDYILYEVVPQHDEDFPIRCNFYIEPQDLEDMSDGWQYHHTVIQSGIKGGNKSQYNYALGLLLEDPYYSPIGDRPKDGLVLINFRLMLDGSESYHKMKDELSNMKIYTSREWHKNEEWKRKV